MPLTYHGWSCECDECGETLCGPKPENKASVAAIVQQTHTRCGKKFFCNERCESNFKFGDLYAKFVALFKQKQLSTCKTITARTFQLMIRVEAADNRGFVTCCTCGKYGHYKTFDAGHWIARAKSGTLLNEKNVHPQCKQCNQFTNQQAAYDSFMRVNYTDEEIAELHRLANEPRRYEKDELASLRVDYWKRIVKAGGTPA